MPDYDAIVLGAGLSGLSAGIRLAYSGRKVAVVESHRIPGGLNSYYNRGDTTIDVGLHSITNYVPETERTAPMNKLFRQLKLRRSEMNLCPQSFSEIRFPDATLRMGNTLDVIQADIARCFPEDADGFKRLCDTFRGYSYEGADVPEGFARQTLAKFIKSPILRDMILCPVMFYGNPAQNDMTLKQFSVMFKSIFLEGMARPHDGMKSIICAMVEKFNELGGTLILNNGATKIQIEDGTATGVSLKSGDTITASTIVSSIGALETASICTESVPSINAAEPGRICFVEAIFSLDRQPSDIGIDAAIIFKNNTNEFEFKAPKECLDFNSHVLCMPGNFNGCDNIPAAKSLRLTTLTSHECWANLAKDEYKKAKETALEQLTNVLKSVSPELPKCIVNAELSTPKTITRCTGHVNGAIYGSPTKFYDSQTDCRNLFLCGTDQGFLGIIGSMMSGTIVANQLIRNC